MVTCKMIVFIRKTVTVFSCLWLFLNFCAHYGGNLSTVYALAAKPDKGPTKAVSELASRLLGTDARNFLFELLPAENGKDVFEIESRKDKIIIRGNTGVSMASGLNWYLKYYCNCHVSLNGDCNQLTLPNPLPVLKNKLRRVSPFRYRNFFNYCTFGYTMPWWDWARWERMIDYMALNGINMPLAITGQEAVWQEVLKELGFNEKQIADFTVGPAYLPWKWMGNIEGLAGPLPQSWIDSHVQLQQKILARERSLGMTPVLQGYTGHVPAATSEVFPRVILHQTTAWAGMPGTWFLDPQDPLMQRIGKAFITKQTELFGTDHLYNADCFNEINPPSNDPVFISNIGKAVYRAMQSADPEAVWVIQGWFLFWQSDFWQAPQANALLGSVENNRMIALDLYAELQPVWNKTGGFYGKPWIWNVLCNLSQQVNMSGDLESMQKSLNEALAGEYNGKLLGIGMMMEGFGYNPVVQEFITEKAWNPAAVDIKEWAAAYARRRYGSNDPRLRQAWQLLMEGPYSRNITNGYESIICATPGLNRFVPSEADRFGVGYDAAKTAAACELLLECSDQLKHLPAYRFDVAHVTREMLANLAVLFNSTIDQAYRGKNEKVLAEARETFLQLIRDIDQLLGTDSHFLLGKWIADARSWGTTKEEKDLYEYNARAIVTMWEPAKRSQLRDYAAKQWNGLLSGFYLPRWKMLLERLAESLRDDQPVDRRKFFRDVKEFEYRWLRQRDYYSAVPVGDTIETAQNLFKKYIRYYRPSSID